MKRGCCRTCVGGIAKHGNGDDTTSTLTQTFPKKGALAGNLDLSLSELRSRAGRPGEAARSYVVTTVKLDRKGRFEQQGSAPNFQGGYLTICTCKHQMRATVNASQWRHKWVAGFTSRALCDKRHWLFFLARIAHAYESQFDLWNSLTTLARQEKTAHEHFGDVFVPRYTLAEEERYSPDNYIVPARHAHHKHKYDGGWRKDIRYERYGRRPALLLGDPRFTFLWTGPRLFLGDNHCRDFMKWDGVPDLLAALGEL